MLDCRDYPVEALEIEADKSRLRMIKSCAVVDHNVLDFRVVLEGIG